MGRTASGSCGCTIQASAAQPAAQDHGQERLLRASSFCRPLALAPLLSATPAHPPAVSPCTPCPEANLCLPEGQDRLLKPFALRPSASAAPKDEKAAGPLEVGEDRDLHPLLQFLPLDPRGSTQGSGSGMGPRGRVLRVPRPEICSLAWSKLSRPPRCALHGRLEAGCTQHWGAAVLLPRSQAPEGQRLSLSRRSPPALPQPTAWS